MESDKKQIPFTENIFVYGIMVKEKSWRIYSDTKERNIYMQFWKFILRNRIDEKLNTNISYTIIMFFFFLLIMYACWFFFFMKAVFMTCKFQFFNHFHTSKCWKTPCSLKEDEKKTNLKKKKEKWRQDFLEVLIIIKVM